MVMIIEGGAFIRFYNVCKGEILFIHRQGIAARSSSLHDMTLFASIKAPISILPPDFL